MQQLIFDVKRLLFFFASIFINLSFYGKWQKTAKKPPTL
jgi:hypothetical protein